MELCKYQTKIQCYCSAVTSSDNSFGLGNGVGSKHEGWQNPAHRGNPACIFLQIRKKMGFLGEKMLLLRKVDVLIGLILIRCFC